MLLVHETADVMSRIRDVSAEIAECTTEVVVIKFDVSPIF